MLPIGSVEIYQVPLSENGGTTASIPSLSGKSFALLRGAVALLNTEYTSLVGGGFQLTGAPGGNLSTGERFAILIQGGKMNTARIPELAPATDIDFLNDYLALYQGGVVDLTRKILLDDLRSQIITGGSATIAPVIQAGTLLYIVPLIDAGSDTAPIAAAAGKSFILRRTSLGMMEPPFLADGSANPNKEYDILSGGGFKLTKPGDVLIQDERFELIFFQLAPVVGPGTTGFEFVKGKKIVNANTALLDVDMNKMIQLRAGATQITLTLPDIDNVPENSMVMIDSSVLSTVKNKIQTTGGQFIYINDLSKTEIYIGHGESVWLYRDEDGWYVVNNFGKSYRKVGTVEWVYKVGKNQLALDGSLVFRAVEPRLEEFATGLGPSYVSEATWQTVSVALGAGITLRNIPFPYRGCFSSFDGTRFRLPDFRNMPIRGLTDFTGAADPERFLNRPGGFQDDAIKAPPAGTIFIKQRSIAGGDIDGFRAAHNAPGTDNYDEVAWPYFTASETRGMNIGLIPVINT